MLLMEIIQWELQRIFLKSTTPTTIEFTANVNSELGDSDIQYEYIDIDCFSNIQTKEYSEIIVYPNPNEEYLM